MTDGKSVLLDIMKHTIGLGFIQQLKVVGTAESTKLYAIDNDRSTILNGTLHTPHESFIGEFGMGNLKILNSLIKMSTYREESSTIDVLTKDGQPTSLLFKDQYGNSDTYRFMSKEIVEQTMTIGQFKGVPWNIEFQPELTKVNLLGKWPTFILSQQGRKAHLHLSPVWKMEIWFSIWVHYRPDLKENVLLQKMLKEP